MKGYISTYNSSNGKGIYSFDFTTNGQLNSVESVYPANEGKCLYPLDQNHLVITLSINEKAGIGILDLRTKKIIATHLEEKATPCFIYCQGNKIYTANYHDGIVMVYKFDKELIVIKKIFTQIKAGCHQVLLYKNYLIVPCLLLDELHFYDAEKDFALVHKIKYDQGTGPRHGIFNKDYSKFYLVTELSNQLKIYTVDKEKDFAFKEIQTINLLSSNMTSASSAAIRLNNKEDLLYISTRGADLLTTIKLCPTATIVQQLSCGGLHPRDFILTKDNQYLLVVNKDSDDIICWKLNHETGELTSITSKVSVPHGIGIILTE